ncbi:hypothetical protein ELQ39_27890 [Streptomyces sp. GB4-14]|uniref:hypothetical protein n=1 Tax=Streptomyces sp. GB4-14 TaxID=2498703 RepID=UPI001F5FD1FF|nr:hypothetical protein [Streptomyces sp. GB4-14]
MTAIGHGALIYLAYAALFFLIGGALSLIAYTAAHITDGIRRRRHERTARDIAAHTDFDAALAQLVKEKDQ